MECLKSSIIEGELVEGNDLKFILNSTTIRAGMQVEVFDEISEIWIKGKVKYINGYCVYSEENGYIYLHNGMWARKIV